MIIYVVKAGDSLFKIAQEFGTTPSEIITFNGLLDPEHLVVGQDILIPTNQFVHIVEPGESLYTIAGSYAVSVESLFDANKQLEPPYILYPGEQINIPNKQKRTIEVNGYVYPTVSLTNLEKVLPYLTYLSIFSYRVQPDGGIIDINDQELISIAKKSKVAPLMVLTNTVDGGGFDSDIMSEVLSSSEKTNTLVSNVVNMAIKKGYYGVDLDFEYIYPEDKGRYNAFLKMFTEKLRGAGIFVSTAIAPKTSNEQKGTLYEAHDYSANGKYADRVLLMTYEWGYMYGPPMAVAPCNEVKKVISFAVTQIPSNKILMGMPNYAYDWILPYKDGRPAEILSIQSALNRAISERVAIQYNERSQAPFYDYVDENGVPHIVWFENARSTRARLELVEDYNLAGVSYWTVNQFYEQNWKVLNDMYNVKKIG